MEHRLPSSDYPFGSAELRFYHRFLPFQRLSQPPPLFYTHFLQLVVHQSQTAEQFYQLAQESLKVAQSSLERAVHYSPLPPPHILSELKALARVTISNSLQLQQLLKKTISLKEGQNDSSNTPLKKRTLATFDFSVHPYYPILRIPNPES